MLDCTESCGPWLIVVDEMDYHQADELGRSMGARGITGNFMRGKIADYMADAARWRTAEEEAIRGEREAL